MHIALYNRSINNGDEKIFKTLLSCFETHAITPVLFENIIPFLVEKNILPSVYEIFSEEKPLHLKTNFLISLGGDGTLLDTICHIGNQNIPILGINLGRLGFLASTGIEDIEFAIQSLIKGTYLLDTRTLIHLDTSVPIFMKQPFALNEFSIHRKDSSSMIKINTFLNGEFLCTYWADGLIVSTPTGSTGYSLSCGGPVIFPQANNFVITPVAPHNLNVRPIIVNDNNIISFEVESRSEQFLCTLDARSEAVNNHVSLAVKKENFSIQLIRLEGQNFLNTLQTKLYWGIDRRN